MLAIILALLVSPSPAHADTWLCQASGYDSFGVRWTVKAKHPVVLEEAQRAALRKCKARHLKRCWVDSCENVW
jgi:hypothetical protein